MAETKKMKIGLSNSDKNQMKNEIEGRLNESFDLKSKEIDVKLKNQDDTIKGLGKLHPSGTATESEIMAFTSDKGIYIGTDTGKWYYWNANDNIYVSGGVYQSSEDINQIKEDLVNIENTLITSLLNLDNFQKNAKPLGNGKGINDYQYNANECMSEVFECEGGEIYTSLNALTWENETSVVYAGSDGLIFDRELFTEAKHTFTIPSGAKYFRLVFSINIINTSSIVYKKCYLVRGSVISNLNDITNDMVFINNFKDDQFPKPIKQITIGKATEGVDYTSLTDAITFMWNNRTNYSKFIVSIYDGTFDAYEENGTYKTSGYRFPPECLVIGYENVKITLNLPLESANTTGSALNHPNNIEFRNITFEASNCRYALHDDDWYSTMVDGVRQPSYCKFQNCKFIYKTTNSSSWGWACGCGIGPNHDMHFDNCYMYGVNGGFSIHSYQGEDNIQGSNIYLNNCFIRGGSGTDLNITSYQESVNFNVLNIHNCDFNNVKLNYNANEYVSDNMFINIDNENGCIINVHANARFKVFISPYVKIIDKGSYNYNIGDIVSVFNNTIVAYNEFINTGVVCDIDNDYIYVKIKGNIPSNYYDDVLNNGYVKVDNGSFINTTNKNEATGYYYNGNLFLY